MAEQTSAALGVSTWEIDPAHTHVEFAARHMMITTVKGKFSGVQGTIRVDEDHSERSQMEATIDAATLDTHSEQRDNHLRSADFLEVDRFPAITFRSRRVEFQDATHFTIAGDLTVRDVTREVVLDATLEGRAKSPWGDERAGFSAKTNINRKDFGLEWNVALEAGGFLVGDEVTISLEVEAVKKASA